MDEQAVEILLVSDWASGLRITSVPQAMDRLGFADDIEKRWEIGDRMVSLWQGALQSPEKIQEVNSAIGLRTDEQRSGLSEHWRNQVGSWDRASILLTDNEKLVARHILWSHGKGSGLPSLEKIASKLNTGPEETDNAILMLSWLGFLELPDGQPTGDYALAEDYAKFNDGLGFSFHTVTLDGDERFGIP